MMRSCAPRSSPKGPRWFSGGRTGECSDGERLSPLSLWNPGVNTGTPIKDGDRIRFGLVDLTFRVAKA